MVSARPTPSVLRATVVAAATTIAMLGCEAPGFVDGPPQSDSPPVNPRTPAPHDDAVGDGDRAAQQWPALVGRFSWFDAAADSDAARRASTYFEGLPFGMPGWHTFRDDQSAAEPARAWLKLLDRLADMPASPMLTFVVSYFVNGWGELLAADERLSFPSELFAAGGGDAEDFALLKYVTLRRLEVPAASMRVIRLRLADGSRHAVLAVRLDETTIILDRMPAQPLAYLEDRWPDDYRPEVAYNEQGMWVLSP